VLVRDADAADVRLPPPTIYAAAVVAGVLLHLFAWPLPLALPATVRFVAAAVMGAVGLALFIAAFGAFRRTGQDPKPWKTTPEFIATGAYRFSRNPMYAGAALLQAAVALGLANGWLLAFVPAALAIVYRTAVRHEEAYLEQKFGESYLAYKRSVRRWL